MAEARTIAGRPRPMKQTRSEASPPRRWNRTFYSSFFLPPEKFLMHHNSVLYRFGPEFNKVVNSTKASPLRCVLRKYMINIEYDFQDTVKSH
jgi:hypothetical protein